MNSREIEARYGDLRRSRDSGSLSERQFQDGVAQLRLQTADGTWHQIDPDSGGWLKWNGQEWEKAGMPVASEPLPQRFLPLLGLILKNTFRTFRQRLPKMLLFGFIAWVLHTFLLVFVNDGFGADTFVGNFLATRGNSLSGTLIWMVVSGLLFSWLSQKRQAKGNAVSKPPSIFTYFNQAGELALASLIGTAGICVIVGSAINSYASVAMAVGFGALIFSQGRVVIALLIRSAWTSIFSMVQGKRALQFSMAAGYVGVLGCAAGFLFNSILPVAWAKLIIGIGLIVGAVFLAKDKGKMPVAFFIPFVFLGIASFLEPGSILAHDGGWAEAGGTLADWLRSEGAVIAAAMGIGPAIGTMLGPSLVQMLRDLFDSVDWNGIDQGDEDDGGQKPPEPDEKPKPGSAIVDETGETLDTWRPGDGPDEYGNQGKPGDVWHWGKWVAPAIAMQEIDDVKRKEAARLKSSKDWSDAEFQKRVQQLKVEEEAVLQKQADDAARTDAEKKARDRMVGKLRKMGAARPGEFRDEVQQHIADENWEGLKDLYRDKLQEQIDDGVQKSKSEQRWATAYAVGEHASRVTLAASKGAIMVIGGPAGLATTTGTMLAIGTISATQEGTESYLSGHSAGRVTAHTCLGLLSGFKDVAMNRFTNMPGAGTFRKIFAPAVADMGETYVKARIQVIEQESDLTPEQLAKLRAEGKLSQSDSLQKALGAGIVSAGSEAMGLKIDGMQNGIAKEGAKLVLSSASGGLNSVAQGGKFADGAVQGLEGGIGARIGSHLADGPVQAARAEEMAQRVAEEAARTAEAEERVRAAIADREERTGGTIPVEEQPEIIQQLEASRHRQVAVETDAEVCQRPDDTADIDQRQRIPTDEAGDVETRDYVNERKALDQMRDTGSSRTAKQAPQELQDAIMRTRNDKLLAPAEASTIDDVKQRLVDSGEVQPGDKLKFKRFRTPGDEGGAQRLGTDEDRRLVAIRKDPETGKDVEVEIDRRHWEPDAYKNAYEHQVKIAGGEDAVTPETHPDYYRNLREMEQSGYTGEEAKHRAWAKTHNLTYTDSKHWEASMDNSDQLTKFVGGKPVQTQETQQVLVAQRPGEDLPAARRAMHPDADNRMLDPAGQAKLWEGKAAEYAHTNQPEAVAQGQKCIEQYMKTREGYQAQGYETPPLDDTTARAMERVMQAPVGSDATPEAMNRLNQDLQDLGYRDVPDALGKIATQHEVLKWSRPAGVPEVSTPKPDLDAGTTATVARSVVTPEPAPEEVVDKPPEPPRPFSATPAADFGVEPAPTTPMGAPAESSEVYRAPGEPVDVPREYESAPAPEPQDLTSQPPPHMAAPAEEIQEMPEGAGRPAETQETIAQPAAEEVDSWAHEASPPIPPSEPSTAQPQPPTETGSEGLGIVGSEESVAKPLGGDVSGLREDVFEGEADTFGGKEGIEGGRADIYGGKEDIEGGRADIYGGKEGIEGGRESFGGEETGWEELTQEQEKLAREREELALEREELDRLKEELNRWKDQRDNT